MLRCQNTLRMFFFTFFLLNLVRTMRKRLQQGFRNNSLPHERKFLATPTDTVGLHRDICLYYTQYFSSQQPAISVRGISRKVYETAPGRPRKEINRRTAKAFRREGESNSEVALALVQGAHAAKLWFRLPRNVLRTSRKQPMPAEARN